MRDRRRRRYISSAMNSQFYRTDNAVECAIAAADAIWEFQNAIVGDPALSDMFTDAQIQAIDDVRVMLYDYAEVM